MKDKNKSNHYNLYYILKENFEEEKQQFDFYYMMLDVIMKALNKEEGDDYGQNNAYNNCEGGADGG